MKMEPIVLDPLPVEVDTPQLLKALRIREGSRNADEAQRLLAEAVAIARPKAIYKLAFVEARLPEAVVVDGLTFTSRVLRVNLDGLNRVFVFVCTSGRELAAWVEGQADMLANYYADAINQAILRGAMGAFERHLTETYRVAQIARMNPGSLPDWPLSQQRPLFALLGDVTGAIGVALTDSLLMTPIKTVSGIIFPTEETFASCQLCPREACPNRRAAYDAALFDKKFRAS
jgi:hypothetical protein